MRKALRGAKRQEIPQPRLSNAFAQKHLLQICVLLG
jgi:hypothetical protein